MTKRNFFLCILLTLAGVGSASAQTAKLSFNMVNKTVKEVLDEVEKQSDFVFIYSDGTVDLKKTVTLEVKNQPIDQVLNRLFAGSDNTYTIKNRQVYINKKTPAPAPETSAKSIELSGVVISGTDNQPVIGASVFIDGTSIGTMTDVNGEYTLTVPASTKEVSFAYLGYITLKLAVKDRNLFRLVTIYEDSQSLDEVTIVAFGKQKKSSVVASIETVNMKDLKIPSANLTTAFAGKIPGMISYQTTGEPGADNAQFFVRGVTTFGYKTSPLILIDGFEATSDDLARMQPDDIESFSILKDASATALYGARGANGIILVNTKGGKEGEVKINARVDVNMATPTSTNKLVDGVTYMRMYNEANYTRRDIVGYSGDFYDPQKIYDTERGLYPMLNPNIDWYNELFNQQTFNTKANLNVQGGGKLATYYVAGGFDNETGLLKVDNRNNFNNNIDIDRFHLRTNVIFKLSSTTTLDTRIHGRFERFNGPYTPASDIYRMVMNANPVDYPAVYDPDEANRYTPHTLFGAGLYAPANPYAEMVRGYETRDETTMTVQATLMQDLKMVTEGLKAQLKVSANTWSNYSAKRQYNPFYYDILNSDPTTGEYVLYCLNPTNPNSFLGNVEPKRDSSGHYYYEARINWDRTFGKHSIGVMTVGMAEEYVLTAGKSTSIFETLPERNLGNSGRISYDFDERYFAEFNYGYNGSEKFNKEHRFGFFPSFGAGWLISNEPFWEKMKETVSTLKLKFTWGKVGNDAIAGRTGRFYYLSDISVGSGSSFTWGMNYNNTYGGYNISRFANPNIGWEISTKTNLGLEVGLFKDESLKLQVDVFREVRDRVYMERKNLPKSAGFDANISGNIGKVQSQGVDGSIDYQHFFNKDFWLTGRANLTYATNKYVELDELNYADPYMSKKGHNINQQWGYVAERLFVDEAEIANSPTQSFSFYQAGDIKYTDVNRDGVINQYDQIPMGFPTVPEIQYGFGLSTGYKKFDFSFFFQGNARVSFFIDPKGYRKDSNDTEHFGIGPFIGRRNALQIVADDYWSETNPNPYSFWPRLSAAALDNNTQQSSWWLRDGSFLRLKTMEAGYTLPTINKLGLKTCRVYLSAENLFVISPFKMWDPEMGANGLAYPINRRFNAGIQLSF
jgi:TonB-linked SusC/RagA family outer membrane protein